MLQMLTERVSSVQASNSVSADWSSSWEQESVLKAVSRPEDRRRRIISIVKIFKYFPLCMLATGGRLSTERCGRLTVSQPPLDTSQPPSERHGNNQQHKIRSHHEKKQNHFRYQTIQFFCLEAFSFFGCVGIGGSFCEFDY